MPFPETLVAEQETRVTSFDHGIEVLQQEYLTSREEIPLHDIQADGSGRLIVNGERHPTTEWAVESLSDIVGIPRVFGRSIPWELFLQNFDRLKVERDQPVMLAIGREGTILNVIRQGKLGYFPAKNIDVIQSLRSWGPDFTLHELRIADRGIEVSLVAPQLGSLEPAVGDITAIGLRITNSETGYRGLKASIFLLRLICTNGAVLKNQWGHAAWSYDPRTSYQRSLNAFFTAARSLGLDAGRLATAYRQLLQREVSVLELLNLWRRISRILGPADADTLLDLSPIQRRTLREVVNERPEARTGRHLWGLFNEITSAARTRDFVHRRQLEYLAGQLLEDFDTPTGAAATSQSL